MKGNSQLMNENSRFIPLTIKDLPLPTLPISSSFLLKQRSMVSDRPETTEEPLDENVKTTEPELPVSLILRNHFSKGSARMYRAVSSCNRGRL